MLLFVLPLTQIFILLFTWDNLSDRPSFVPADSPPWVGGVAQAMLSLRPNNDRRAALALGTAPPSSSIDGVRLAPQHRQPEKHPCTKPQKVSCWCVDGGGGSQVRHHLG